MKRPLIRPCLGGQGRGHQPSDSQSCWSPVSCAAGSCPGSASAASAFLVVFFAAFFAVVFLAVFFAVVFFAVVFFAVVFLAVFFAAVVFVATGSSLGSGTDSDFGADAVLLAVTGASAGAGVADPAVDATDCSVERRHQSQPATPAATRKSNNITRRIHGR